MEVLEAVLVELLLVAVDQEEEKVYLILLLVEVADLVLLAKDLMEEEVAVSLDH